MRPPYLKKTLERCLLLLAFVVFSALSVKLFSETPQEMRKYLQSREKILSSYPDRKPNVEPVNSSIYVEGCSDCHIAYSRGLLPERSWRLLMSPEELANHFEDAVFLDESDREAIEEYLIAGAVESGGQYRVSRKIKASLKESQTPKRITTLTYIHNKHRDIPDKYISQNAKVLSLSQCSACHQRVDQGIYHESEVYIPYARLTP